MLGERIWRQRWNWKGSERYKIYSTTCTGKKQQNSVLQVYARMSAARNSCAIRALSAGLNVLLWHSCLSWNKKVGCCSWYWDIYYFMANNALLTQETSGVFCRFPCLSSVQITWLRMHHFFQGIHSNTSEGKLFKFVIAWWADWSRGPNSITKSTRQVAGPIHCAYVDVKTATS